MGLRIFILSIACISLFHSGPARADLTDVSTDVEEMISDSDAAVAQAKAAKLRAEKERAENEAKLSKLLKSREAAKAKHAEATEEMKKNEAEISALMLEQAKMKKELQKLDHDIAAATKAIKDSQAKAEKKKAETEALKQLLAEKQKKSDQLNKQREDVIAAGRLIEEARAKAQAEAEKAAEDEKLAAQSLAKTKTDEAAKKGRLEAQIAQLKERYKQSQERIAGMEKDAAKIRQANTRLELQAKVGEGEVAKSESHEGELKAQMPQPLQPVAQPTAQSAEPAADPAAIPAAGQSRTVNAAASDAAVPLTLKRDCKIHEGPSRDSKTLGVKLAGESIGQGENKMGWISFALTDGQTGFVAKSCF